MMKKCFWKAVYAVTWGLMGILTWLYQGVAGLYLRSVEELYA